jgi:hypothetical protein
VQALDFDVLEVWPARLPKTPRVAQIIELFLRFSSKLMPRIVIMLEELRWKAGRTAAALLASAPRAMDSWFMYQEAVRYTRIAVQ